MSNTASTWNWNKVSDQLRTAFRELPVPKTQSEKPNADSSFHSNTQDDFFEYLGHNELELAWEVLAELGERGAAGQTFWLQLAQAAQGMNLLSKAEEAFEKSRVKEEGGKTA